MNEYLNKLFRDNASEEWDEESGPWYAMSMIGFLKSVKHLSDKIENQEKIIEKLKELYAYETINKEDDLEEFETKTIIHLSAIKRKDSQTIQTKSKYLKQGKLARKIKKEVEELESEK